MSLLIHRRAARARRGQTLVLFAVTLLLLTMMVVMTVALGMKAKERMELQTLADSAAYSNSVATARTLNAISVMNRVQVAHIVSTLGTLSLISWSTLYWQHANNAARLFTRMAVPFAFNTVMNCLFPPGPLCGPCAAATAQVGVMAALMRQHANQARTRLRNDTQLFANETQPRWEAAELIYDSQRAMLGAVRAKVSGGGGSFGAGFIQSASLADSGGVQAKDATSVNDREIGHATYREESRLGPTLNHVGHIVMGSRGHRFTRSRDGTYSDDWGDFPTGTLNVRSRVIFAGGFVWTGQARGHGYLGSNLWEPIPGTGTPNGSFANDIGGRTRTAFVPLGPFPFIRACSSPLPAEIIALGIGAIGIRGVRAGVGPNQHEGLGHNVIHAYRTFPKFIDYHSSALAHPEDLDGQPKNFVGIEREHANRNDPWDMSFNFQVAGGQRLDLTAAPRGGISRAIAVGTGVTYYHRRDHWKEPPNLFAPYWRAGLARASIDSSGVGDLGGLLAGWGAADYQTALNALQGQGYKGLQFQ